MIVFFSQSLQQSFCKKIIRNSDPSNLVTNITNHFEELKIWYFASIDSSTLFSSILDYSNQRENMFSYQKFQIAPLRDHKKRLFKTVKIQTKPYFEGIWPLDWAKAKNNENKKISMGDVREHPKLIYVGTRWGPKSIDARWTLNESESQGRYCWLRRWCSDNYSVKCHLRFSLPTF